MNPNGNNFNGPNLRNCCDDCGAQQWCSRYGRTRERCERHNERGRAAAEFEAEMLGFVKDNLDAAGVEMRTIDRHELSTN